MKKAINLLMAGVMFFLLFMIIVPVHASAESPHTYETIVYKDEIVLYAGDFDNQPEVEVAQIGDRLIEDVSVSALMSEQDKIQTLLMLDNSLSISKEDREKSISLLNGYIDAADKNEKIRVALFDEHVNYLTDYTDDKNVLQEAVSGIEFNDQETYLTDVLYEALKQIKESEDAYRRIVVISDGVDNKAIGVTEKELDDLIKETEIQIFTVGCKKSSNNEELKKMYALARGTNGKEFTLVDYADVSEIYSDIIGSVKGIYSFRLSVPADLKDGLDAVTRIGLSDGTIIDGEIKKPLGEASVAATDEATVEATVEEKVENTEPVVEETVSEAIVDPKTVETPEEEKKMPAGILAVLFVIILLIVVLIYILIVKGNKSQKTSESNKTAGSKIEPQQDAFARKVNDNYAAGDDGRTVLENSPSYDDSDVTQMQDDGSDSTMIFGGNSAGQLSENIELTAVNSGEKFRCSLKDNIVIGRKHTDYGIVADLDYSISKRHCIIFKDKGYIYIQDLHSTNGTFVNDNQVLGSYELHDGDTIRLGRVGFLFQTL